MHFLKPSRDCGDSIPLFALQILERQRSLAQSHGGLCQVWRILKNSSDPNEESVGVFCLGHPFCFIHGRLGDSHRAFSPQFSNHLSFFSAKHYESMSYCLKQFQIFCAKRLLQGAGEGEGRRSFIRLKYPSHHLKSKPDVNFSDAFERCSLSDTPKGTFPAGTHANKQAPT